MADKLTVDTELVVGSRWRHRNGGTYELLAVGRIEADLMPVAIYQSEIEGHVWVRPIGEFEDGRFTEIGLND